MEFDLGLFCEVGAAYQAAALAQLSDIIKTRYPRRELKTIELHHAPWMVDVLLPKRVKT
jgi:hypothetical protein